MKVLVFVFCYVFTIHYILISRSANAENNADTNSGQLSLEDHVRQLGYPVEAHNVTTQDQYILTLHRIPHGKTSSKGPNSTPVFLVHGLLCASAIFLVTPYNLGYVLADAGFDVWLLNARGTTNSRRHVHLDPDDQGNNEYWDFSFHEIGYYDLPASIDYILDLTGYDQLFIVGHSLGCTTFFVMGATRPEYMSRVKAMAALTPMTFPQHSQLRMSSLYLLPGVKVAFKGEVFPHRRMSWVGRVCGANFFLHFCLKLLCGYNSREMDETFTSTLLRFLPAGTSLKLLDHCRQSLRIEFEFRQFDYGIVGNLDKYDSLEPPTYDLMKVNTLCYFYYSLNDKVVVPEDVFRLAKRLPNVKLVKVPDDSFSHSDFASAKDAKTIVYDDMIAKFRSLEKEN